MSTTTTTANITVDKSTKTAPTSICSMEYSTHDIKLQYAPTDIKELAGSQEADAASVSPDSTVRETSKTESPSFSAMVRDKLGVDARRAVFTKASTFHDDHQPFAGHSTTSQVLRHGCWAASCLGVVGTALGVWCDDEMCCCSVSRDEKHQASQ